MENRDGSVGIGLPFAFSLGGLLRDSYNPQKSTASPKHISFCGEMNLPPQQNIDYEPLIDTQQREKGKIPPSWLYLPRPTDHLFKHIASCVIVSLSLSYVESGIHKEKNFFFSHLQDFNQGLLEGKKGRLTFDYTCEKWCNNLVRVNAIVIRFLKRTTPK